MSKKRRPPPSKLFSAVAKLESDDARAAKVRRTTASSSSVKSKAARSQTDLTGQLIECRILLQRALGGVGDVVEGRKRRRKEQGDRDENENNGKAQEEAVKACDDLLCNLLHARKRLCLPSTDDDSLSDGEGKETTKSDYHALLSSSQLDETVQSEYDDCKSDWIETLNRRHHDLRLHSGLAARSRTKFQALDKSFWDQVESTVSHERLLNGQHLGREDDGEHPTEDGGDDVRYAEVFDDSRVYRQLLSDFISSGGKGSGGSGGTESNAAVEAAAERLRRSQQKKNKSAKKDVDRRASKGRKIRYGVHSKLTNFTFPVARPVPVLGEDDWFRSLFGGAAAGRGNNSNGVNSGRG